MNVKNIEEIIKVFKGDRFSSFLDYINNHELLDYEEKLLINKMYSEAGEFKLWNFSNLHIGYKNSINYLKENYSIDKKTCEKISRALSYEWM